VVAVVERFPESFTDLERMALPAADAERMEGQQEADREAERLRLRAAPPQRPGRRSSLRSRFR
jgi:hypothetical protein